MNDHEFAKKVSEITRRMKSSNISEFMDKNDLVAPIPFRGKGKIKLIILGQDPTVRKMKHREQIKVTLLLDQKGRLPNYLRDVCEKLGLKLDQNAYVTNILKNFFIDRPDQLEKKIHPGLIKEAFSFWRGLLLKELDEFKDVPIITLGEPVLNCFMKKPVLIRNYWGYEGPGVYGKEMRHISPEQNDLRRHIFPFVHIHGLGHKLYREGLNDYIKYMRNALKW